MKRNTGNRELSILISSITQWLKNNSVEVCLAKDESCSLGITKAHSIQSRRILEALAQDGHVYIFEDVVTGGVKLTWKGRNKATTFTGYCNHHDTHLFREIDFDESRPFNPDRIDQHILLTLRTVSREYWAKLNAIKLHGLLLKMARNGDREGIKQLFNVSESHAEYAVKHFKKILVPYMQGSHTSLSRIRRWFESLRYQIANRKFHLTNAKIYRFDCSDGGNIAVSSPFAPIYDYEENTINLLHLNSDVAEVALNVFPYDGNLWVIFTYHKRLSDRFKGLFKQLDSMDTTSRGIALSKMIVSHCENLVLSPRYVKRLNLEDKHELEQHFYISIQNVLPLQYSDIPNFNFFDNLD